MRARRRLARTVVATITALMLPGGWAPAAGAVTPPPPGIKVIGASPGIRGKLLVTFKYITCRVDDNGFHGYSRAGDWTLTVRILRFNGFHRYVLPYGVGGGRFVNVDGPGPAFSTTRRPAPMPLPAVGGSVNFPRYGVIAIGFPSMFNTDLVTTTTRAAVAGSTTAPCYTPPRPR